MSVEEEVIELGGEEDGKIEGQDHAGKNLLSARHRRG
jgi:hypothetical protein